MKKGSFIKRSLTYIGLPLLLSILLVLVVSLVLTNQRNLELNNLEIRMQLQATLFAEKISGKLNALEILLDSLAQQTKLMDLSKRSGEALLERTVRENQLIFSEIEGVCILNTQGEKQFSSFYTESEALHFMRKNLIRLHIEQQFIFSTLPFTDEGKQYLSLSRSVEDSSGKVVRVVALIIRTNLFHEQLNLASTPGIEQLVVNDEEGSVVAFWTDAIAPIAIPQTAEEIFPAYESQEQSTFLGSIRTFSRAGKLYTSTALSGFPYTLTLKTDILEAMASYDKALVISFSFLLLMVLISVIYITRLGFEVTKKEAEQEEILESLAQKIKERTHDLKRLSEQDALTGLPNRRKINSLLMQEIHKCNIQGCTFSLMILDIDRFKLVNDTYGHQTGDAIILAIVEHLSAILEGKGTLARWGGDELMVLLPNHALSETMHIAHTMCQKIGSTTFKDSIHTTLSIGVTQFKPEDSDTTLIRRADMALYIAKDGGRNQVQSS